MYWQHNWQQSLNRLRKLRWNYFIALERDLEIVSRYVEFCEANCEVYSIEFAHLLFAAASEVDVVAKLICNRLHPTVSAEKINQYRPILLSGIPDLPTAQVFMPRYGLTLMPWDDWSDSAKHSPLWWSSYNHVKHERDTYFKDATLKNALNALAALLLLTYHHYRFELSPAIHNLLPPKDVTRKLKPESTLLRLSEYCYGGSILLES